MVIQVELSVGETMGQGKERYPLEPVSIGEDSYIMISRGHHDIHQFMAAVRQSCDWPLGVPEHLWMKTMPTRKDGYTCWYERVPAGTRGAWPCTYVREAYNDERYEARFPEAAKSRA